MKKFLSLRKRSEDGTEYAGPSNAGSAGPSNASGAGHGAGTFGSVNGASSTRQSISTAGSRDSINEVEMFDDNKITNDQSLNINPSILNNDLAYFSPSVLTRDTHQKDESIFSSGKRTMSTKQSSNYSNKSGLYKSNFNNVEFGKRLQILEVQEELLEMSPTDSVNDKLRYLSEDMAFAMHQYSNSVLNLTTAVINIIDLLKNFVNFINTLPVETDWNMTTYNNVSLRKIMKIYLNIYDNLLNDEVYIKLKLLLLRNFNEFSATLDTANKRASVVNPSNIVKPQNFAIGCNDDQRLPNEDVLVNIINKMASSPVKLKEQNGSFIAPIVRGISKKLNILTLYFGYPNPSDYHLKLVQSLHDLYDDIHVVVIKNQIELAATASLPSDPASKFLSEPASRTNSRSAPLQKFKLPFRVPTDVTKPPMSLSISIENASRTSGTMGGFIYPKIDIAKKPHLESYSNSKFAISCGHVCLNNSDDQTEYPHVSAPSSVLISLYKKALVQQYEKLSQNEEDSTMMEAKVAYGSVIQQVDSMFPLKRVKLKNSRSKLEYLETRNLPIHRFGQIIWGERTLMNVKGTAEKKLSDLAIIKVNKNLTCDQNFLGDDIAFNEFDPALMFDNLYVRKVIDLRRPDDSELNINEVDDEAPSNINAGLPVFKYGSTTKFTQGNLNGIKMVYWLDGAIHSSEFVINSIEHNSAFAAGGDSGSWILSKLEDCKSVGETKGLGVLGMLHSYDGEFRQFGLFTPMVEILGRLEEVTNIKWGVVGVPEKDSSKLPSNESDSSSDLESVSSLSDLESEEDLEGALPPEID